MRASPLLAAALAACTTSSPDAAGPAGSCDAARVQDLVGEAAASHAAAAQRRSGARQTRIYETGSPVTMDYRPDRLNIETDRNGAIVRLSCG